MTLDLTYTALFGVTETVSLSPTLILILVALAFGAGLMDAIVGGGGLILVPGLLAFLPQVPIPVLFGTNKLASVAGTTTASLRFARSVPLQWRWLLPSFIVAVLCSIGGGKLATVVSPEIFRPIILVFLMVVALINFRAPSVKEMPDSKEINRGLIVAFCALVAFYDGFIGPGTGVFLIFGFVIFFGRTFLQASAHAKVINMASNIGALIYFLPNGLVLWPLAIILALANMAGSFWGSHLAIRKGSPFIRLIFRAVVVTLLAKVGWDVIKIWFH